MTEIVTLAEAKAYLRVTNDREDGTIALLIAAASETVMQIADNWDGVGDVPDRIKLAVLARVAESFDNREQLPSATNELPMLYSLRGINV